MEYEAWIVGVHEIPADIQERVGTYPDGYVIIHNVTWNSVTIMTGEDFHLEFEWIDPEDG
jgi:hypothetical protein